MGEESRYAVTWLTIPRHVTVERNVGDRHFVT